MSLPRFTPGGPPVDGLLTTLHAAPYVISRPAARLNPFVFASPHSGRLYPESFLRQSRLSALALRRSEDAHVDDLFAGVPELGAPFIAARFPRAYIDANRAPGELDETMFDGPLHVPVEQISARVNAGLGVIPRVVRDGAEIYRAKLKPAEAEERLSRLHRRYHAGVSALLREAHAQFAAAVLIDCHSMPSAAGAPDIVLGDRYGTAASNILLRHTENAFQLHGFKVGRNVPYAGGYTTQLYGEPVRGVHALQVEVNRALYLDEERIELTADFAAMQNRLMLALAELVRLDARALRPQRMRLAAE
ncbi:MAG: N-formylglutamate amidohydrolase [Alphaproteobacteria bacterium]|uniref:N-formylglutamate amidohydrolase n=1 Tax=Bradyrhizobium sp. TaxID=376 RepID=UPI001EBA6C56|nr:N-formylglutamate amidohydrolase [Bradyrhizobium sp.]MBV9570798.1 N-formylglutamate amidohydrolase [Alphaproteobacteria bacterium]MBV9979049.1 N-formylglutamate amidohydrolase [Bradyrhizobium sp.]